MLLRRPQKVQKQLLLLEMQVLQLITPIHAPHSFWTLQLTGMLIQVPLAT